MYFSKGELVFLRVDLWDDAAKNIVVKKGTPARVIEAANFRPFGITVQLIEMPDIVRASFVGYDSICSVSPSDIIRGSFLYGHEILD